MSKEIISDELLRKAVARAIEIESAMYERKFALEKEHSFSGKSLTSNGYLGEEVLGSWATIEYQIIFSNRQ